MEILRESWRWHFYDLLRDGKPGEAEVTEFISDDEEFEDFVRSMEDSAMERRIKQDAESEGWDPVD